MAGTSPAMTMERGIIGRFSIGQWNPQLCGPTNPHRAEYFFVIFVDEIFTTLFEPPFTNVSDAIAPIAAISCLYRAGNGD